MKSMSRSYQKRQRAEDQARTRARIVEAMIALHQEKGVAATSVSDIAARAGVGKVTVYRHFPDETAMVTACSGTYFERNPPPDPEAWRAVNDPRARLARALAEVYAYHRATEPMIAQVLPELRDTPLMEPYHALWRHAVEVLAQGWPDPDDRSLRAALALALSFDAWRLLTRDWGLSDAEAAALALRLAPPLAAAAAE